MSAGRRLRELLARPGAVLMPGAPNALTARIAEEAGFRVVLFTGAGFANMDLGDPGLGLTTMTEVAQQVGRLTDAVDIPVVADADTGFGNALNVRRTVRELERAGAAGITLEDQVFPKRCGHFEGKQVIGRDEMVMKITAALEARRSADFVIIALRFYSCVGSNHTTLDALRALRARHRFTTEAIDRITVYGSRVTVDHVGWPYQPQGLTAAQLNLPYCVATLLLEGEVFVDQFREELVADPLRIALSRKVEVIEDPAITAKGAQARHAVRVQVLLKDGIRLEQQMESARGDEQNFASPDEVIRKFLHLAGPTLGAPAAEELCDVLLHVEKLEAAALIPRLLSRPPR
jgi:hypothetical protein